MSNGQTDQEQPQTDQERDFEKELTRLEDRIAELESIQTHSEEQRRAQGNLLKAICRIIAHESVKAQSLAGIYKESAELMLEPLRELDK